MYLILDPNKHASAIISIRELNQAHIRLIMASLDSQLNNKDKNNV